MKNITFFILAILALLAVSLYFNTKYFTMKKASTNLEVPVNEIKEIHSVLDKQLTEWNNGNLNGYMEGYWKNDSFRFISKNGILQGWDNLFKMYQSTFNTKEKMGHLLFQKEGIYTMSEKEKEVLLVGRWEVHKQDTQSGTFYLIFKEIAGEWKIIQDHTY